MHKKRARERGLKRRGGRERGEGRVLAERYLILPFKNIEYRRIQ